MAGNKFAAAVPDVATTAAGTPDSLATPSAKKAALLSSRAVQLAKSDCSAQAKAIKADLEPGQTTAPLKPAAHNSSSRARAHSWFRLAVATAVSQRLEKREAFRFRLQPLSLARGAGHHSCADEQLRPAAADQRGSDADRKLRGIAAHPPDGCRVPASIEAFVLDEKLHCPISWHAAHRRRRMQRAKQPRQADFGTQPATDLRAEMTQVRQTKHPGRWIDEQLSAQRLQSLINSFDDRLMLPGLLIACRQRRLARARGTAGDGLGFEGPPLKTAQCLRSRPEKCRAVGSAQRKHGAFGNHPAQEIHRFGQVER